MKLICPQFKPGAKITTCLCSVFTRSTYYASLLLESVAEILKIYLFWEKGWQILFLTRLSLRLGDLIEGQMIATWSTTILGHSQTMVKFSSMNYFRGGNFREQKLSRISRILAKFAKVNVAKFFRDIDSRKFMNAKNIFFLEFGQVNVRQKKIKNKNFNSFYLLQTTNLVKLVQISKRFSQELSS